MYFKDYDITESFPIVNFLIFFVLIIYVLMWAPGKKLYLS